MYKVLCMCVEIIYLLRWRERGGVSVDDGAIQVVVFPWQLTDPKCVPLHTARGPVGSPPTPLACRALSLDVRCVSCDGGAH